MAKFQRIRYGWTPEPVGRHVSLTFAGRTILGEVVKAERNDVRGCVLLTVKHFNGDPWPVVPHILAVDLIEES